MSAATIDPSLPWGKVDISGMQPFIRKTVTETVVTEAVDKLMVLTGNTTIAKRANVFASKASMGILDSLSRILSSSTSSPNAALQFETFDLVPRHNITELQPPHPPHPFTVSITEWWDMHKAALVATVLGLVLLSAMFAAAGVWFCCVKPRRQMMARERRRTVETCDSDCEKCDGERDLLERGEQDVSEGSVTEESGTSAV